MSQLKSFMHLQNIIEDVSCAFQKEEFRWNDLNTSSLTLRMKTVIRTNECETSHFKVERTNAWQEKV